MSGQDTTKKDSKMTVPELLEQNAEVNVESVKRSKAMYTWKFNENISRIEKYLSKWPDKKSSSLYKIVMDEQEQMTERYSKIEVLNMHIYMNTEDGSKERDECQDKWKTTTEAFDKTNLAITDVMSGWKVGNDDKSSEGTQPITQSAPNIIATDIRPRVLSLEFTVTECEKWIDDLNFYFY